MSKFFNILSLITLGATQAGAVAGSLGTGKAATISVVAGIIAACSKSIFEGVSKLNPPKQ